MTTQNYPIRPVPEEYNELCHKIWDTLGYPDKRKPLLIGIDGRDGAGKSTLAAWLSWQLEMSTIELDLYLKANDHMKINWRLNELKNVIETRLTGTKPMPLITEGVLLLDALEKIERKPDFLIFVKRDDEMYEEGPLWSKRIKPYFEQQKPEEQADYILTI